MPLELVIQQHNHLMAVANIIAPVRAAWLPLQASGFVPWHAAVRRKAGKGVEHGGNGGKEEGGMGPEKGWFIL